MALIDGAGPESLRLVAERLRASVEATPLGVEAMRVTISIGAAVFDPRSGEGPEELLRRADYALYRASNPAGAIDGSSPGAASGAFEN